MELDKLNIVDQFRKDVESLTLDEQRSFLFAFTVILPAHEEGLISTDKGIPDYRERAVLSIEYDAYRSRNYTAVDVDESLELVVQKDYCIEREELLFLTQKGSLWVTYLIGLL